jgi:protein-disulfide isomerase
MRLTTLNIVFTIVALAPASSAQTNDTRQPLARIGDQAVYEEDLLPSLGPQLLQLKNQEYELRMTALRNLINQRLVQEDAKESGLSVQEFLAKKVDLTTPPPSASELESYYLNHKDPLGRPFDEIKPQLVQTVTQIKVQQTRNEYVERLQQKAGVSILYSRPRVEIDTDVSRIRGKVDAPVTIVEFADYECPYCQAAEEAVKQVMDKYQDQVRFVFLDFPLRPIHPLAQQAAEASRCAGEQGKFWEYHDRLISKGARLDPEGLQEQARQLGADLDRFGACLQSRKFEARVESDVVSGYKSGVSGTPTFYVNGVALVGNQPASAFTKIIDAELAALPSSTDK